MERSTMLFMGKSTLSMAIFNSKLLVYQAGYVMEKYSAVLRWDIRSKLRA